MAEIFLLILLILINAFFAASEMAFITLNDDRMSLSSDGQDKKDMMIKKLLEEPSKFLSTIQIGITLAGFLASAVAADTFAGKIVVAIQSLGANISPVLLKSLSMIVITLILSYFTLVFGELVPKRLAMKKAVPVSRFAIGPLNFVSKVTAPFVTILSKSTNATIRLFGIDPNEEDEAITEEEIRMMVSVGEEKGTIDQVEKFFINNIFEFDNKTVDEVMTHRTDVVALQANATFKEVIKLVNYEKYTRIPVYEDNLDDIVGVLHIRDLLQYMSETTETDDFKLSSITMKPYLVPASKRIDVLFSELQKNQTHMAIIIDEYGGTAGIATMEDLIEEIVGNIFDEYDEEEQDIEIIDENTYMINGSAEISAVEHFLGIDFPDGDYETLSGFIISRLGKIPGIDEKPEIETNGLILRVEEADEKKITKIKVGKTRDKDSGE